MVIVAGDENRINKTTLPATGARGATSSVCQQEEIACNIIGHESRYADCDGNKQ